MLSDVRIENVKYALTTVLVIPTTKKQKRFANFVNCFKVIGLT